MEEEIKKTAVHINKAYICFWALAALLVLCGETSDEWTGLYAGDVVAAYVAETVSILLTAACVPASMKLFSRAMAHKINVATLPDALRLYARWSVVRLALLALPVSVGLLTYYLLFSTTGALCALIGLTASLFCFPGKTRLCRDLHIES